MQMEQVVKPLLKSNAVSAVVTIKLAKQIT
jgi:hypothetical protein